MHKSLVVSLSAVRREDKVRRMEVEWTLTGRLCHDGHQEPGEVVCFFVKLD
jgi:hypothetical protein